MKVVPDTNIFIATLIKPDASIARLYWHWREGHFVLLTSRAQLDELRDVSRRPKFKGIIRSHQAGAMMNTLKARAVVLQLYAIAAISPDPDDVIIAIALQGQADYLVSLNMHDVVKLGRVGKTKILHPRDFLNLV